MILNHTFIQTYIVPKIKKASLWMLLLLIGLSISITIILIHHEAFSYALSLAILSFVSILFIIPIYIICYKYLFYFYRLTRFIHTYASVDQVFKEVKVCSYGDAITLEKLLFKPVSCVLEHTEKIYYMPYGVFQYDIHSDVLEVLISDRFIVGVKYE